MWSGWSIWDTLCLLALQVRNGIHCFVRTGSHYRQEWAATSRDCPGHGPVTEQLAIVGGCICKRWTWFDYTSDSTGFNWGIWVDLILALDFKFDCKLQVCIELERKKAQSRFMLSSLFFSSKHWSNLGWWPLEWQLSFSWPLPPRVHTK